MMAGVILAFTFIRTDYSKAPPLKYKHPSFKPQYHQPVPAYVWAKHDRSFKGINYQRTLINRHDRKRKAKKQSI